LAKNSLRIRKNQLDSIEWFFENKKYRNSIEAENRQLYWDTYIKFYKNWRWFRQTWQLERIEDSGGHKLVLFPEYRQSVFKLFRYLPEDYDLEKRNYELLVKHGYGDLLARTRFFDQGYCVSQRVQPLKDEEEIPRPLLDLFLDESRENFGWLNSKIVAVDFDYIDEDRVTSRG